MSRRGDQHKLARELNELGAVVEDRGGKLRVSGPAGDVVIVPSTPRAVVRAARRRIGVTDADMQAHPANVVEPGDACGPPTRAASNAES